MVEATENSKVAKEQLVAYVVTLRSFIVCCICGSTAVALVGSNDKNSATCTPVLFLYEATWSITIQIIYMNINCFTYLLIWNTAQAEKKHLATGKILSND